MRTRLYFTDRANVKWTIDIGEISVFFKAEGRIFGFSQRKDVILEALGPLHYTLTNEDDVVKYVKKVLENISFV
jgi:hypothetical protein